jgi:hypothetical protein
VAPASIDLARRVQSPEAGWPFDNGGDDGYAALSRGESCGGAAARARGATAAIPVEPPEAGAQLQKLLTGFEALGFSAAAGDYPDVRP